MKNEKNRKEITRLKRIYRNMVNRCHNKNFSRYKYYGNRGISVCSEWIGDDGFFNFYIWSIKNGYDNLLQIDRINNDGNYEPSNCRWVDGFCQHNNTKRNCLVFYNNKWQTLAELAKEYNIDRYILRNRIFRGWKFEDLFNKTTKRGV